MLIEGYGMFNKKKNSEGFDKLKKSIEEAILIEKGELVPSRVFKIEPLNIAKIRHEINKTQEEFANMLNISISTLRNWEQGRRRPDGAALTLLRIVKANPKYIEEVLLR